MDTHYREQGLRVHHLANLGGLVALAGLDLEPPDFILGALLSIAREAGRLTPEQRSQISAEGKAELDQRASAKRAWTSWRRAQDLHSITLSASQIERILTALGAPAPSGAKDPARTLITMLEEAPSNGR